MMNKRSGDLDYGGLPGFSQLTYFERGLVKSKLSKSKLSGGMLKAQGKKYIF